MMAVIKAHGDSAGRVQPFKPPAGVCELDAPAPHPAVERLAEAELRIASLEQTLRDLDAASEAALSKARDAGRIEGAQDADRRLGARVAALADGIAAGVAMLETRLGSLDALAAMLARRALDKLLISAPARSEAMAAFIGRQLEAIKAELVVAVCVSGADFGDDGDLDVLASTAQLQRRLVKIDPDLQHGTCRFDLVLGQVDLDIVEQWRTLGAFLDSLPAEVALA